MTTLLLVVIYIAFIGLGLPDSLFGTAWPAIYMEFGLPVSWANFVTVILACGTTISSLFAASLINRFGTAAITAVSTTMAALALLGFSCAGGMLWLCLFAIPLGLAAGAIDTALNHYVAVHYRATHMNFLHCFYGLGAIISPNLMALALKYAHWNEGYRWTAYVQIGILAVCILSLPLTAFFSYCAGETTSFLWTSSYFAGTKQGMSDGLIASFGSLVFGGLQQTFGIWIMPLYLLAFAVLNFVFLELAYRAIAKNS